LICFSNASFQAGPGCALALTRSGFFFSEWRVVIARKSDGRLRRTGNEHFDWCSDMRNNLLHSELYPAAFRGEGDTLYFVKSTSKNDLASRPSDILDRQCYPFLRNSCRLPQQEKFLCSVDMNRFQLLRYAEDIDSGSPGNHGPKTNNPTTSTP
jgi:hypothetical protein